MSDVERRAVYDELIGRFSGEAFSYVTAEGEVALRLPEEAREYLVDRFGATECGDEFVVVPADLWADRQALVGCFKASHAYVNGLAD
jgi:hypothetical protein